MPVTSKVLGKESVGSKLLLNATDTDLGENSTVTFRLKYSPQSNHFKIQRLTNKSVSTNIILFISYSILPDVIMLRFESFKWNFGVINTILINFLI